MKIETDLSEFTDTIANWGGFKNSQMTRPQLTAWLDKLNEVCEDCDTTLTTDGINGLLFQTTVFDNNQELLENYLTKDDMDAVIEYEKDDDEITTEEWLENLDEYEITNILQEYTHGTPILLVLESDNKIIVTEDC